MSIDCLNGLRSLPPLSYLSCCLDPLIECVQAIWEAFKYCLCGEQEPTSLDERAIIPIPRQPPTLIKLCAKKLLSMLLDTILPIEDAGIAEKALPFACEVGSLAVEKLKLFEKAETLDLTLINNMNIDREYLDLVLKNCSNLKNISLSLLYIDKDCLCQLLKFTEFQLSLVNRWPNEISFGVMDNTMLMITETEFDTLCYMIRNDDKSQRQLFSFFYCGDHIKNEPLFELKGFEDERWLAISKKYPIYQTYLSEAKDTRSDFHKEMNRKVQETYYINKYIATREKNVLQQIFTPMKEKWDEIQNSLQANDDQRFLVHSEEELRYTLHELFEFTLIIFPHEKSIPAFLDALPCSLFELFCREVQSYTWNTWMFSILSPVLSEYCQKGMNSPEEKLEKVKILKKHFPELNLEALGFSVLMEEGV